VREKEKEASERKRERERDWAEERASSNNAFAY